MNCKQAQRDIALWAGHDLDDAAHRDAVRTHVAECPCCRMHYQRIKQTLHVLERADRPATFVSNDSIWPELAARINQPRPHSSPQWNSKRFGGWMPLLAMTAASFVLLVVVIDRPQPQTTTIHAELPASIPATPVIRAPSDPYAGLPEYQSPGNQDPDQNLDLFRELRLRRLSDGL